MTEQSTQRPGTRRDATMMTAARDALRAERRYSAAWLAILDEGALDTLAHMPDNHDPGDEDRS